MTRLPAASIAPSAVTTDASEARRSVNLWHVAAAVVVVYVLLTAALVVTP